MDETPSPRKPANSLKFFFFAGFLPPIVFVLLSGGNGISAETRENLSYLVAVIGGMLLGAFCLPLLLVAKNKKFHRYVYPVAVLLVGMLSGFGCVMMIQGFPFLYSVLMVGISMVMLAFTYKEAVKIVNSMTL